MDDPQYLRAIHSLKFLTEAFRGRQHILKAFKHKLNGFIIYQIDSNNILMTKLALESVSLLNPNKLEHVILKAFKLNNEWINEAALKACRYLPTISKRLETHITMHFFSVGIIDFFKNKKDILFYTGLSSAFMPIHKFCQLRVTDNYMLLLSILLLFVYPAAVAIFVTFLIFMHFISNFTFFMVSFVLSTLFQQKYSGRINSPFIARLITPIMLFPLRVSLRLDLDEKPSFLAGTCSATLHNTT